MQDRFNRNTWGYIENSHGYEIWANGHNRALVIPGTDVVHQYYQAAHQKHRRRRTFSKRALFLATSPIRSS